MKTLFVALGILLAADGDIQFKTQEAQSLFSVNPSNNAVQFYSWKSIQQCADEGSPSLDDFRSGKMTEKEWERRQMTWFTCAVAIAARGNCTNASLVKP